MSEVVQKGPDQIVYDHVYRLVQSIGYEPYLFNPPSSTPYPFVQLGQIQIVPKATKSFMIGDAYLMVDVWGNRFDRKKISDISTKLIEIAGRDRYSAEGLQLHLNPDNSSFEVMPDNSTNDPLWRSRISLMFNFY